MLEGAAQKFLVEAEDEACGELLVLRRIVLQLDEPNRDGVTELSELTNLPADGPQAVSAQQIARLYRKCWTIETAFQDLVSQLNSKADIEKQRIGQLNRELRTCAGNGFPGNIVMDLDR